MSLSIFSTKREDHYVRICAVKFLCLLDGSNMSHKLFIEDLAVKLLDKVNVLYFTLKYLVFCIVDKLKSFMLFMLTQYVFLSIFHHEISWGLCSLFLVKSCLVIVQLRFCFGEQTFYLHVTLGIFQYQSKPVIFRVIQPYIILCKKWNERVKI